MYSVYPSTAFQNVLVGLLSKIRIFCTTEKIGQLAEEFEGRRLVAVVLSIFPLDNSFKHDRATSGTRVHADARSRA